MSGLIYKNFWINKWSFLFTLIVSFLCCAVIIVVSILSGPDIAVEKDGVKEISLNFMLIYYLAFMLPLLASNLLFAADESKICSAFAMSTPQGGKGHIESKYWYILIVNLTVLFISFITDTITFGILGGNFSAATMLMIIFCWRLLLSAIETPFIIRFGSQKGLAIKGLVIAFIVFLVILYFMFGDISWLINTEDPLRAFMEWLKSGKIIFSLSLFPFVSIAAYWLSCKISVKLFRNGAENYEQ